MAQGLRYQQDAAREDARYREQVARANEELRLEQERAKRAEEDHKRKIETEDAIRQGTRALTDERIGQISMKDTAPGYLREGGLQQAGGDMLAPTRFAAGLAQHHDRILSHARAVAEKLPPELHAQFFQDIQTRLEKDQTDAMFAKAQSDITNLGKDLATPEAGGAVQDQLPAVQERSKALLDLLKSAEGADPKQRLQVLQTVNQGLHAQRADLIQTAVRRKRMAAVTATLGAQNEAARTVASDPSIPPEIAATLHARIDERQAILEMANLDPDMTTDDLMRGWHSAGTTTVPRPMAQGKPSTPATKKDETPNWVKARDMAVEDARAGVLGKLPEDPTAVDAIVRKRQQEYEKKLDGTIENPLYREPLSGSPKAPTQRTAIQNKPIPYAKAKPESQKALVEEIKADMQQGGQQLASIFANHGVDPESLPPEVLMELLGSPKAKADRKASERASKLEHVGPNF